MCLSNSLISSSLSFSANGFIRSLPFLSFKPSLTCLKACSSSKLAWYFASVKSFTSAMRPAFVWPLPSLPWQETQCLFQFSWTSAASTLAVKANPRARAPILISDVIILVTFRSCYHIDEALLSLSVHLLTNAQHFVLRNDNAAWSRPGAHRNHCFHRTLRRGWS